MLFGDAVGRVRPLYLSLLAASSIAELLCLVGVWLMRRWAVYAYAAFAVVYQAILLMAGIWSPEVLIAPGIVLAVMFSFLPRMR